MKKLFLMATVACLALASCDDVPEPYAIFDPNSTTGGGGTASALPYTDSNLSDWSAVTVKGVAWSLGNTYAKATGYNSTEKTTTESESWLVSPAISLEGAAEAHITLDHVIRYVGTDAPLTNHTMWITTEYSGDVAAATWTQLGYNPVESPTKDWTFYAADEVSIPTDFAGKTVYIAFKFLCGSSSTTWEVNNFHVLEGAATETPPEPIQTDFEHLSIADFIAKADANTAYEITGVASALNEGYASLDLTEGDATVYVYKMVDASGNKVSLSSLGIEAGDTVTVTGKYYKYEKDGNVKHELNPGTYVSHKKGSGGGTTGGGNTGEAKGTGTETDPYNIAAVMSKVYVAGDTTTGVWISGYIVGSCPGKSFSGSTFTATDASESNFLLADDASCTDYNLCIPIALPSSVRSALSLVSVPGNLGKKVSVYGDVMKYFGVAGMKNTSKYAIEGETGNDTGDDDNTTVEAKGTGTEADPFNVAAAVKKCQEVGETATTEFYYVKGIVKSVNTNGVANYGNINVTMVDVEGSSTVFTAYQIMSFGGEKFTATDVVKAGDVIVVKGQLVNYKGNTPETTGKGAGCLVSVNGSTEGGTTGGDTGDTGNTGGDTGGSTDTPATDGMTLSAITSAVSNLPSGAYGTQAVATDTTWVSWIYGGVTYKGVKICQSTSIANTIQMQGHASDAAKQGFIFNADAFASEIKTVTVVLKVKDSTSAYDPGYSLYAGSAAHPAEGAVEANASDPAYTVADGIRTYTQVFDLSGKNAKFFTIANDKVGALNIEKIIVTLK